MNEPIFSVIVPLYNKEKYIRQTINSILNQTYKKFELWIIDDGSTDDSVNIVKEFNDSRVFLHQQVNNGVSSARNTGIQLSRGEYICFIDADDSWDSDYLETLYELYQKYPCAQMASTNYRVKYNNRITIPKLVGVSNTNDEIVKSFLYSCTAPFWICNSSCVSFRRKELVASGERFPEGETVYEDLDLWLRFGYNHVVAHSPRVCVTYNRLTDNNARKAHEYRRVYSKSLMNTLEFLKKKFPPHSAEILYLENIGNRRMIPYIYSLLLMGKKKEAISEISRWKPTDNYRYYRTGLYLATLMPRCILNAVHKLRLRIF